MQNTKSTFQDYILYFAWIVSLIATLGSLYFSEIKGFIPCELCWYQRILMYPLVIIIGIAAFDQNKKIKKYVLPLSIIGGCISFYHYLIQKVPGLAPVKPCVGGVSCSGQYINWLGFITIPFLALIAFILITVLMLLLRQNNK
ncbi:disulfide oxidoreductase [Lederbergia sp. NSJ-179]|uniref:disulfide oxidoreductase n=1 Tax=Lederbergia sp. NSJ-179 TaxID=2931402 RepID=UPI001FD14972|nr:disulfide oxidoreductase [Lederbergia sp. NSJ-179]MCJ7840192.1 disulfide oxidoreductase [Lederbergia sp. NSJ-179]